ncbi:MAG: CsgG/HfaB family protein [Proteobacteria bacterium]|nr:CsgG/HfaB family protein [Pseudomonadota bacterium]
MMKCARIALPVLLCATALACAGPPAPPALTSADVARAQQEGRLAAFFDELQTKRAAAGAEEAAALDALLREAGQALAQPVLDEFEQQLETGRHESGAVPLAQLDAAATKLAPIERWSPKAFEGAGKRLQAEREGTNAAIAKATEAMGGGEPEARLAAVARLQALAGADSEAGRAAAAQRDAWIAEWNQAADAAVAAEDYTAAQALLERVAQVEPNAAGLDGRLAEIDTKVFEKRFWQALEAGDPGAAYDHLQTLSESPRFEAVRKRLGGSAGRMAEYFDSLAETATGGGELWDAYGHLGRAADIREMLKLESRSGRTARAGFAKALDKQARKAEAEGMAGLAWGTLDVMQAFTDDPRSLRGRVRKARESVETLAIKGLTTAPFEDPSQGAEFGEAVAAKVIQYLFEHVPHDVRIIEREQLEDVLREKQLSGDGAGALASANYLVEGTILEAKVDSTEKRGRKTQRVVTETVREPNPKHEWWRGLKSGERKDTPEPPETIMVEKKEDVTIDVTVHRKVGLFSVSYRVIDATSAKVVFADSVRTKVEHQDDSTEGVELGDFKLEFKLAELPSDIEILAQLADEVSGKIGQRLVDELKDSEVRYAEAGARSADEGNWLDATQHYAYSHVIALRKGQDVDQVRDRLRRTAVAAHTRSGPPASID